MLAHQCSTVQIRLQLPPLSGTVATTIHLTGDTQDMSRIESHGELQQQVIGEYVIPDRTVLPSVTESAQLQCTAQLYLPGIQTIVNIYWWQVVRALQIYQTTTHIPHVDSLNLCQCPMALLCTDCI
eukprot:GHUV01046839.1.p1 GENE.GHUV01046839.1~~GHUV01046839.1.p1  ORF type:complete len:126 (+),score=14.72 GHUV01046839.1:191-568(+)